MNETLDSFASSGMSQIIKSSRLLHDFISVIYSL